MYKLETFPGNPVERTPVKDLDPNDEAVKQWRQRDECLLGKHGHRVDDPKANGKSANCHGTTFDRGNSDITEAQAAIVLRDNYAKLSAKSTNEDERQRASVCDIVAMPSGISPPTAVRGGGRQGRQGQDRSREEWI